MHTFQGGLFLVEGYRVIYTFTKVLNYFFVKGVYSYLQAFYKILF